MKRFLAILCTLAMLLSVLPSAAFAAENSDLQAAMDKDSSEIIVLEEDTSNLTVNRDTTIDLNGHDLDSVSVLAGTLYIMDSATADYTVADGVYGHVTNVTGAVKAAEGYLQVGDSFHAVNLDIYAMTLRAADVGVYYKSHFAADEIVAAEVESFGVALSVVTAPSASNLETYCGYSAFTGFAAGEGANSAANSTLLKGIMKAANGDDKNAKNAAMPVYGRAYIKTADGYFFGETVKRSLQEQVEAIDGVWETLSDAQKAPVLSMLESYTAVMENWEIPNIQGIQIPGEDAEIEIPIEVTAENGIVTETVTVEQNGVSVTVPAGSKLAENASGLTLTITPVEAEDTGLTLKEDRVLIPMDVHVEGLAADNTQPLTIYLGKVMPENLNMGNYAVYHVENGSANEMTLIPATAEFTAHNQYKYSLDGELTLYIANFSLFAAAVDEKPAWQGGYDYSWYTSDPAADTFFIRNADQLAGFGAIVGGMATDENGKAIQKSFNTKVIKLLADIDLGDAEAANTNKIFYPIGYYYEVDSKGNPYCDVEAFKGTFDGNGHTIKNFYQNTWEMKGDYNGNYYNTAMGLFAYVYDATIKNLTIENFSSDGEFTPTGVIAAYGNGENLFENIAIRNCNPRVYNTGNGGIVGWDMGGDSVLQASKYTFKNISVDASNTITALWGSWDVACAGIMGYLGTHSEAHLVNCHVAATIDVFNDVCGNYQYYWYRYCGMMIGTVDRTKADGSLDLINITATNCEVDFGDRHEYYYCEFVKNTQASYTHDYQFSRVDNADITITNGVPSCNHDHAVRGTEVIDGKTVLVEDKQAVYLPFRQLFGGYGWGVDGVDEYTNIQIRDLTNSVEKFAPIYEGYVEPGQEITIGQLFAANGAGTIDADNVQVFVSPADDKSTADGVYTAVTPEENKVTDWTKGTLVFSGYGKAVVSITDYNLCKTTKLELTVKSYTDDLQFIGETNQAYCPVCEAVVEWTAIGGEQFTSLSITHNSTTDTFTKLYKHVYLSESINYTGTASAVLSYEIKSTDTACLHLNGKEFKAKNAAIYGGGRLNIMGDGLVEGGRQSNAATISTNSTNGKIQIYSGTWKKKNDSSLPIIAILGGKGQGVITLYKDAVIDARGGKGNTITVHSGVFNINGASVYGTSGACITVSERQQDNLWYSGTININDGLIQAGAGRALETKVPSAGNSHKPVVNIAGGEIYGYVSVSSSSITTISNAPIVHWLDVENGTTVKLGALTAGAKIGVSATDSVPFTEILSNAADYRPYFYAYNNNSIVDVVDNRLVCKVATYTDDLEFKADGKAWCVKCGKLVEWTAITQEEHGDLYFGDGGPNPLYSESYHFYLKEDFVYNNSHSSFLTAPSSPGTCCFHLNGHDMSTSKNTGLFFGWPGTLNIMGNGTVTGNKTKPTSTYSGASVGINTNNAKGVINLYSGTYTAVEGSKNSIVAINENGGEINIYEDVRILPVYGDSPAISIREAKARNAYLKIEGADLTGVWLKTQTPEAYTSTVELIDATLGKLTVAENVNVIISGNTTVTLELAAGASHTITVGGSQQVIDATENMQMIQIRNGAIVTED